MFEILPNPSLETILIVVRGALLLGAFWIFALAFVRWRRSDAKDMQRLHAQLERAFGEVRSLHETMTVMSARIEAMSERADSEARMAPAGAATSQRGYDLAARLARNGSTPDELVASCGITRHEAELLARLHGAKSRETAAPLNWQMRSPPVEKPAAAPAPQPAGRKRGSLLSVVG